jgi:hypothetical protein
MHELNTLPLSIRQRLELSNIANGTSKAPDQAQVLVEVARHLATSNPEVLALLLGTQLGYRELSHTVVEETRNRTQTVRRVWGIAVGSDETYTTTGKTTTHTRRLGR